MKKHPYYLDEPRRRDVVISLIKHRAKNSSYYLELFLHISLLMT